jgi:hypothetical protein
MIFNELFNPVFRDAFTTSSGYQLETESFTDRVIADGGTVEDKDFLDRFIVHAKGNGYYDDIVAAYSPSWGVKGTTNASKLYSVKGATQDLEQSTGASQPEIVTNATNGKTVLRADGNDHCMTVAFTFNRPETFIFGGLKNITWVNVDRISDGGVNARALITNFTTTPQILVNSGQNGATNTDLSVGVSHHLRALMSSSATELQVDNNSETSGAAALFEAAGFTIFSQADGTLAANAECGLWILLNSAVDANYDSKMAAIYDFSRKEYATP